MKTSPPERYLRRARRSRTTTQQSPRRLQWDAPNSLPKLPLVLRRSPPPSNTPIPRPTSLTTQTASNQPFCHNTLWTEIQTDRWDRRQLYSKSAYALLYIDTERRVKNCPRSRIKIKPTALPRPHALSSAAPTLTFDAHLRLNFKSMQASYVTQTHTKTQVQRSVGSKDRVKTNGRTDGRTDGRYNDCFTFPANTVGNYYLVQGRGRRM